MGGKSGGGEIEVNRYMMSMHLGLCYGPVDAVTTAWYGEKIYWSGKVTDNASFYVSHQGLFGGDKKEGGIEGYMSIFLGKPDQVMPNSFAKKLGRQNGADCPAFRGLTTVLHTGPLAGHPGFYWCANSPYLKPMWYTVMALPKSLGVENSAVNTQTVTAGAAFGPTSGGWKYQILPANSTIDYSGVSVNDASWPVGTMPFTDRAGHDWAQAAGYPTNVGTVWPTFSTIWIRKQFEVSVLAPLTLEVLADGVGDVFINGVFIGRSGWPSSLSVTVPATALRIGTNLCAIRAIDDVSPIVNPQNRSYLATTLKTGGSFDVYDANPAHIIYEVLTNTEWGLGLDPSESVNVGSFKAAAQTLFDEKLGLSMAWSTSTPAEDFINEVKDHINAVLFPDPKDGKLTLKLIRDDYDAATLRSVNPDNADVTAFSRKAWGDTINEITVTWTNPRNEAEETVTLQDNANIAEQGEIVSDQKNYYGVRTSTLAWTLAARDLRAASAPLCSVELELDLSFWDLRPGDCLKLTWPELGITDLIVRVWEVKHGGGRKTSSKIVVSVTEDIFALPVSAFVRPQETEWQDLGAPPSPIAVVEVLTLPTYMAAKVGGVSATSFEYPVAYAGILAAPASSDMFTFDLRGQTVNAVGSTVWAGLGTRQTTGYGKLAEALVAETTSTVSDFGLIVGNGPSDVVFLFIGAGGEGVAEIALIEGQSGGAWSVKRGVLDTVPKAWPEGTPVWFLNEDFQIADTTQQSEGSNPSYKLLGNTTLGQLEETLAPTITGTLTDRIHRPLRPANVKVEGTGFGEVALPVSQLLGVSWSRRNRLTEERVVLGWDAPDVTPEAGQTALAVLSNALTGAALAEVDLGGGTSATLDVSAALGGGLPPSRMRVSIYAKSASGLWSLQAHSIVVTSGSIPANLRNYILESPATDPSPAPTAPSNLRSYILE